MLVFKPKMTQSKTFLILKIMLIDLVTYYQHNSRDNHLGMALIRTTYVSLKLICINFESISTKKSSLLSEGMEFIYKTMIINITYYVMSQINKCLLSHVTSIQKIKAVRSVQHSKWSLSNKVKYGSNPYPGFQVQRKFKTLTLSTIIILELKSD